MIVRIVRPRLRNRFRRAYVAMFIGAPLVETALHTSALCGGGIVRDHEDGLAELLVELLHQREHVIGALAIEIARRLVGDDDLRVVDDRARDRDALLLTARELARIVIACGPRDRRRARPSRLACCAPRL